MYIEQTPFFVCFFVQLCYTLDSKLYEQKRQVIGMLTAFEASELFHAPESPTLQGLLEGGRLPALFSGLPAASRAHLAAVLARTTEQSVLVVCPDDAAAEVFARDVGAMLGREIPLLGARDYTFYTAESVSRQMEQKRLRALHALLTRSAPVVVENKDFSDVITFTFVVKTRDEPALMDSLTQLSEGRLSPMRFDEFHMAWPEDDPA